MGHPEVQDLKGAQLIGPAVETVDLLEQAFILYKKGRSNDGTVGLLERRDAYEQVERTPPRPGVLDSAVYPAPALGQGGPDQFCDLGVLRKEGIRGLFRNSLLRPPQDALAGRVDSRQAGPGIEDKKSLEEGGD